MIAYGGASFVHARRRPRVLIADDHPGMLKSLQFLLSRACEVIGTVADGDALLDSAGRLQPDVVVVDLNMPTVNGLDACRQLTQSASGVKVILLSAADDAEIARAALAAGASAFLVKSSLDGGELVNAVRRACGE
jgi:DNA-binding NarL/FixJ family response regulator